jgi:mercuric reductase
MYKSKFKKPSTYDFDVIVIGSGSAGSVAAQLLAEQGRKVALVEESKLGGSAVHNTTIPTHALMQAATTLSKLENSGNFGIRHSAATLNYQSLQAWKDKAIRATGIHDEARIFTGEGIQIIKGHGHFISPWTLSVGLKRFSAKKYIIATGSNPTVPDIAGLDSVQYFTYDQAPHLKKLPKSLAIIGGEATAYEYAALYAAFGTKVHVFANTRHMFAREDEEVGDSAEAILTKQGARVHLGVKITNTHGTRDHTVINFEQFGQQHRVAVESIMIAGGGTANTDMGLENTRLTYTQKGIKVNRYGFTTQPHIMAVGDVVNGECMPHEAIHNARIAAHNLYARKKVSLKNHIIPRIAYGETEIACIGVSEHQMKMSGDPYQTSIAPLGILGKSHATNYTNGFVKIIASHHGYILGASIVAPHASEMINELSLAVQYHHRACDVANIVHGFPTWSEAIRVAAQKIQCI